ncbi:MAG: ATP-dependent DNA ligase [bacterium]
MMAQAATIEQIEEKYYNYWMEPKLDGMRLLFHFPGGKLEHAWTRGGRDVLPQVPELWVRSAAQAMHTFYVRTGFEWWDCEFGYGSHIKMDFNATMRVMGSGPEVAQAKALDLPEPRAVVFDVPDHSGELWERRMPLDELDALLMDDYAPIIVVPQQDSFDNTYYTYIVKEGGEGVMLKNPTSLYHPGKRRANTWYKLKKFDTLEMFITGADPGQGKYEGMIGALVVETVDGLQLRCSGMTDEQRVFMTMHLERLVAEKRVVEVKYFGLTAGTPRHPQFLRYCTDKARAGGKPQRRNRYRDALQWHNSDRKDSFPAPQGASGPCTLSSFGSGVGTSVEGPTGVTLLCSHQA